MVAVLGLYTLSLALTVVIEVGLARAIMRGRVGQRRVVRTTLFANLATHPLAVLLVYGSAALFPNVELAVFLAEWLAFRFAARLGWLQAAVLAFVLNLVSAFVGLVLGGIVGL